MTITTALDDVYKEIDIMKQLNHSNIISLFELIDDPSSDKLYLIMPLADFGESMSYNAQSLEFRPNDKLYAKNIDKAHKQMSDNCLYYDEATI